MAHGMHLPVQHFWWNNTLLDAPRQNLAVNILILLGLWFVSLDTIRYDWVEPIKYIRIYRWLIIGYDAALAAARRSPFKRKKKTVDNEIIDSSTTNANFLKILYSAFAQKNGERIAVTGSAPKKIGKIAA